MASQTLYLRSTRSAVESANTSVDQLSTSIGTAQTTGTSVKIAKNTTSFAVVPNTASSTAAYAGGPFTITQQGWLFDSTTPGTYDFASFTCNYRLSATSASGVISVITQLWIVTATTSAVTSVSTAANSGVSSAGNSILQMNSSGFTPSTTVESISCTATTSNNAPIIIAANQYLYIDMYVSPTTASSSNTQVITFYLDAPTTPFDIVTPNFTAAGASTPTMETTMQKYWHLGLLR